MIGDKIKVNARSMQWCVVGDGGRTSFGLYTQVRHVAVEGKVRGLEESTRARHFTQALMRPCGR